MTNMKTMKFSVVASIVLFIIYVDNLRVDAQTTSLADAINDFNILLYQQLVKPDSNLIYSGFSVATVLNMLLAGARTTTEQEIRKALGYDALSVSTTQSQTSYHDILTSLRNAQDYDLNVANSMWIQLGFKILSSFNSTITNTFLAALEEVDFVKQTAAAEKQINNWVNTQTNGKIPTLFDNVLTPLTRIVLVNAIYFKGQWITKFKEESTRDYSFKVNGGNSMKNIPMMNVESTFPYTENQALNAQILQLPYKGNDVSMIIVLPRTSDGLKSMESQLTVSKLKTALKNLHSTDVVVKIPKFKSDSTLPLNKALQNLGIRDAFTGQADLSGIDGRTDLFVSDAIQKAMIEVNEEGTVAAAATGIVGSTKSAQKPQKIAFVADHPFLYFIYHKPTGVFLFTGRFSNP